MGLIRKELCRARSERLEKEHIQRDLSFNYF